MTDARLTGIAAQAASGRSLGLKRKVEYRSLPSKSALNRCVSRRMPFSWTVNPYRGCEIGCHYCYAAYTHEFLGFDDPAKFDSLIFSKEGMERHLSRELARGVNGEIAIGTGTDPYQPAERRFETTKGILEVFSKRSGHALSITTKSDLILRDIDLLGEIAARNDLRVNITVTTMDRDLARVLEPRAPRPDLRAEAVRQLRWRGIRCGVLSSPVLPLITDSDEILGAVAEAAKRADASYWLASPLFLRKAARARLMPVLEARFPRMVARYRSHFDRASFVSSRYRKWLEAKTRRIRARHALKGDRAGTDGAAGPSPAPLPAFQPSLFAPALQEPAAHERCGSPPRARTRPRESLRSGMLAAPDSRARGRDGLVAPEE